MTPTRDRAAALRRAAAYLDPKRPECMLTDEDATLAARELRQNADLIEVFDSTEATR